MENKGALAKKKKIPDGPKPSKPFFSKTSYLMYQGTHTVHSVSRRLFLVRQIGTAATELNRHGACTYPTTLQYRYRLAGCLHCIDI